MSAISSIPTPLASVLATVEAEIADSLHVKEAFLRQCSFSVAAISVAVAERLQKGGKLLLFGNGGSAADAQHIAAEFVGRFQCDRPALPAIALTTNTSTLTAVANDYGYEEVFARQVTALGSQHDVVIGLSTSGSSRNVLRGLSAARARGMLAIGFTGLSGKDLVALSDLFLCVPSEVAARIQECHILAGHIISGYCERVVHADEAPVGRSAKMGEI
ncbi:MAG: D-sedoheptulose 7-phosphate isomerase [Candidatus Acidiferrales bacterium]